MTEVLRTARLTLREMDAGDLDVIAAQLAHPEVMRYFPRCYSRDEAEEWVQRQCDRYQRHGCGYWLALERESGVPAGQAGVLMLEIDGVEQPVLGYILDRPFWGRGLATEAAAACRDWAFTELGASRVVTLIRPENEPSLAVAAGSA